MPFLRDLDNTDADSIGPAVLYSASDPGAVGAGKLWYNGTDLKLRNQANAAWDAVGGGGGSGGGFVLLGTYTAAASASLDIATRNASGQSGAIFQSDYDEYAIEIINLVPATTATFVRMRMSTDGGSSYDSSAIYSWVDWRINVVGAAQGGGTGQTQLQIEGGGNVNHMHNTATRGLVANYRLFNPLSTTVYKTIHGQTSYLLSDNTNRQTSTVSGTYESATAVNAFQIFMSSGNLASGTVRVYGIAKT